MSRPSDWSPLADRDPVPGDADQVRGLSARYGDTAQEIRDQVANLRTLAQNDDYWHAASGEQYAEHARALAARVDQAQHRYTVVRDALRSWADDLEDVQRDADRALRDAKDAQHRLDAEAHTAPRPRSTAGQTPEQIEAGAQADAAAAAERSERMRQAAADLDAARKALAAAVTAYDAAGRATGTCIRDGLADDPANDSRWDRLKESTVKAVKFVTDAAGWVATVAGVLGVVLMFVPGLQGLGLALLTVSRIATWVSLAGHVGLAATGNGSWGEVLFDVAALGVMGAAGRVLKAGVGVTAAATRGATRAGREQARKAARREIADRGGTAASSGRRAGSRRNRAAAAANGREVRRAGQAGAARGRRAVARAQPTSQRALPARQRASVDPDVALELAKARAAARHAPDDPVVQQRLRDLQSAVRLHNVSWGGAVLGDAANKSDTVTLPRPAGPDLEVDVLPFVEKDSWFPGLHERTHLRLVRLP